MTATTKDRKTEALDRLAELADVRDRLNAELDANSAERNALMAELHFDLGVPLGPIADAARVKKQNVHTRIKGLRPGRDATPS